MGSEMCIRDRASAINALKLDPIFKNGNYLDQPKSGLQAFGYVYSAWLFSQAFFREGLYLQLGLKSQDQQSRTLIKLIVDAVVYVSQTSSYLNYLIELQSRLIKLGKT